MTIDRLFIKLYLDEDVSVLVADLLRTHGFDVLSTRDSHNLGQSDSGQLIFAALQQRAVLTHNRHDFEVLHRVALTGHHSHAGIIIANRRSSDFALARRVLNLINLFTADEITNQLLYI